MRSVTTLPRRTQGDTAAVTEVITQVRRMPRAGIRRTDYVWECLPMAQVEVPDGRRDAGAGGFRIGEIAVRSHRAPPPTSSLVQRIVDAGTPARTFRAPDCRVTVVGFSAAGETQLRHWQKAHGRRANSALVKLPACHREAIGATVCALAMLVDDLRVLAEHGGARRPMRGMRLPR